MKIKILLFAALLIYTPYSLYAQGWKRVFTDENMSMGLDALSTNDGGYITLGDYILPTGAIRNYIRLTKVDAAGDMLWQNTLFEGLIRNDNSKELATAPNGGVYALATSQGEAANEKQKMWLLRFDAAGDTLWTRSFRYDTMRTYALDMHELAGGSLILAGHIVDEAATRGVYLIQVDENGNVEWENTHLWSDNNFSNPLEKIIPASSGGFMGVGNWDQQGVGHVVHFDNQGALLWQQEYSLTEGDDFWGIEEAPNGDFVICGGASGFSGITPQVIRIDSEGNLIWHQLYNYLYNKAVDITAVPGGGYALTGSLDNYWWYPTAPQGFTMKINETGEELWFKPLEDQWGGLVRLASIDLTQDGGFIAAGEQGWDHMLIKMDGNGEIYTNQIKGRVFYDQIMNCEEDIAEQGLGNWVLELQSGDQNYYTVTNDSGYYDLTVDTGSYTISLVTPNNYWSACENDQMADIQQFYDTTTIDFAIQAAINCPLLSVNISVPFLRRCFDNTYTVHYCNEGPAVAETTTIEVELDQYFNLVSSDLPATDLGNNTYRFDVGDIPAGSCSDFSFVAYLDCDDTVLGQTHCVKATAVTDSCGATLPLPAIALESGCEQDSVYFILRNIGDEDMQLPNTYIVIEDDVMYAPVPYDLDAGDSLRVTMPATGSTYRLEAMRFPDSFNDEYISQTVEGCSDGEFSTGFVNQFPLFTGSLSEDIDCQENIGAYDPNDKRAFPTGFGEEHYIKPKTPLDYHIRFQNTGTDTAFTVVIKDTLSAHLNPATLRVGAASHDYKWSLEGQGILTFTFENIMLPDSNINEPASHGFVKFAIDPYEGLELGTRIENQAAIYFDFNEPIFTNTAFHVIQEDFIQIINDTNPGGGAATIHVSTYPNPARDRVTLSVSGLPFTNGALMLYNAQGQLVHHQLFDRPEFELDTSQLAEGVYFFQLGIEDKPVGSGRIIIQ